MSWREKRKLIPGGCGSIFEEIALQAHQIQMAADPRAPTTRLIAQSAKNFRAEVRPNR